MALIKCKECGAQISDASATCPKCGAPIIKDIICPDCGSAIPSNSTVCPNCGAPIKSAVTNTTLITNNSLATNIAPSLESSNNFAAELTGNAIATLSLWIGIIVGGIFVLIGIYFLISDTFGRETIAAVLFSFGFLIFILCLIAYTAIRLVVNVSYRLTRLDNKMNPTN
ncbi:MAG: zinc-ribbon domain-containing protein [Paludibacteraceae bacterium]|nr:zinc-ribbon domain-containing protein [Paludibacteraceae bacterium]